jgi:hypothetical protein
MSLIAWLAMRRSGFVTWLPALLLDRQRVASFVLLHHPLDGLLGLAAAE